MDVHEAGRRRLGVPARLALSAHSAMLGLVAVFIVACAVPGSIDANIGLGLSMLLLAMMGAPWTLAMLLDEGFTVDAPAFVALAAGGALLNLALHAAGWLRWGARS